MTNTVRYLSRADVEALGITPLDVVDVLNSAFEERAAGKVEMPPKIGVHTRKDAFIHAMPAYLEDSDVVGIKWVSGYPTNARQGLPYLHGLAILSDADTGCPVCVMDATWITETRTAAASVLGIRRLVDGAPSSLAIIGCGRQGQVHLDLLEQVFPSIRTVHLYDPNTDSLERLARAEGGAARRVRERDVVTAIADADVVVTAAPIVREPASRVTRSRLRDACVVCAIDFDSSVTAEVARRATAFVVDDILQYRQYREVGYFENYPEEAIELAELIRFGRPDPGGGIALYTPLGLALEDVALAATVYRRAGDLEIGTRLEL